MSIDYTSMEQRKLKENYPHNYQKSIMKHILTPPYSIEVSFALQEWFSLKGKTETTPNEIMLFLIEKGIYKEQKGTIALQLRKDLRKLCERNQLYLTESAYYVQRNKNKK